MKSAPTKSTKRTKAMVPVVVRMPLALVRSLKRAAKTDKVELSSYIRDVLASYSLVREEADKL